MSPHYARLLDIYAAALGAVDPYTAVFNAVHIEDDSLQINDARYVLGDYARVVVIGAGKATARMAQAVEALLDARISAGLIIVKDGHGLPLRFIEQIASSHPVPGVAGHAATRRILGLVRTANEKTLVLCLLSGGASALMVAPVAGVTLEDKQVTTQCLLNAGATINEINAVRKHLSAIKGGGLARAAYPADVVTLILSDVIGDPLDVIASGPTVADASTFAEANAVVGKYQLRDKLPLSVTAYLNKGLCGQAPETLKQGDEYLENCRHVIVANNRMALNAAYEKIFHFGEQASIVSTEWAGEARDSARALAQRARAELAGMRPHERRYLLCGGETTVTVCGNGRGGRNQEFALAFALEIAGERGIALLSAGTDGNDGPTDAAGAIVDGDTVAQAMQCGLDAQLALQQNDAYTFFQQLDACTGTQGHLKTGPTGTNVMDIQMVMLDKIDAGTRQ